jgi:hypothetical protein
LGSEIQRLWYVRLAEEIRGPFPTAAVVQDLALGRLPPETLLSTDGVGWAPAAELEAFSQLLQPGDRDAWAEERRQALRRWADERGGQERGATPAEPGARRAGVDRRRADANPRGATPRTLLSQGAQGRGWLVVGSLAAVVLLLLLLALFVGPTSTLEVRLLK